MTNNSPKSGRQLFLSMLLAALIAVAPAVALAEGETATDAVQEEVATATDASTDVSSSLEEEEASTEADGEATVVTEESEVTSEETDGEDEAVESDAEEAAEETADDTTTAAEDSSVTEEELQVAATVPTCPTTAISVDEGTYALQATLASALLVEVDSSSIAAGTAVQTASYTGYKNQLWVLERYGDTNWYRLRLKGDNTLALGITGTAASGTKVTLVSVAGTDQVETLWAFVPNADGTVRLVSAAKTSLALAVKGSSKSAGATLQLAASKDVAAQRMALRNANPAVAAGKTGLEGAYFLIEKSSGLVAAIDGGKTTNGANVELETKTNATSQRVYLEPVDGGGYYIAWVIGSSKVLSVKASNILEGANIHQYKYNGSDAQKWAVVQNSNGTYTLVNKGTGLKLGAAGTTDGSNIEGSAEGSSFTLKRVALLKAGIVEVKPQDASAVSLSIAKASTKNGGKLVLWNDTDTLNQRFQLVSAGGTDLWRVRTGSSGGYLWVRDGSLVQFGKGSNKANANNTWKATFRGGWYGLMLADGSERAINLTGGSTAKGTKVELAAADGSDAQHLTFTSATLVQPGVYFIKNAKGKLLDVAYNSSTPGANVQMYKKTKSRLLGEYFTIEKAGKYVRIKNTYSELCVTAKGKKAGANVTMQNASTANSQKWLPQIADGGYIMFRGVGAYSKVALHVAKGSAKNGANVVVGKATGGVAQKWKLIKTTYNPYTGYMLKAMRVARANTSATNYLMVVDRANTHVMIMKNNGGSWKMVRTYLCSCGKSSSPTISGTYTVGSRGYQFTDDDHTCYYWTQISGDYLFHSVLYRAGTKTILDGRLGRHISMGCVRLDINNAKWIYDNVPSGSKIIIY